MSTYDPGDSSFYDLEYFISMEYRYFSRAHASRVRGILKFMGDVTSKKILDVGGGSGHLAHLLQQKGGIPTVVDYSEAAIQFGRQRFSDLEFVRGSVYELDKLEGKKFDIVTFLDVIEHLDRPDVALQQLKTVLAPGGLLFLSTDNEDSPFATRRWLRALDFALAPWSAEGSDYLMIKRVEKYRRQLPRKNYHESHIHGYGLQGLMDTLEKNGWVAQGWRTYHLYSHPVKNLLTLLLGSRSGVHMIVRCAPKNS